LVACGDGETYIASSEVYEKNFPIIVERYSLNTEGKHGAGKFRGGFGVVRNYRMMNSKTFVTIQVGRHDFPPWGINGGQDGSGNKVVIYKNGKPAEIRRLSAEPLSKGDLVSIRTSSGGGFGNPLDRDPKMVLRDVRDELISVDIAREVYGVIVDPDKMEVDLEKTQELRKKLRSFGDGRNE